MLIDVLRLIIQVNLSEIYTIEDIPLSTKEAVASTYLHAVLSRYSLTNALSNMLRLCPLEAYSVLFDLISQRAIMPWDLGHVARARSTLVEQESALSVAIDLEGDI